MTNAEVTARAERFGPNAMRSHHVGVLSVLGRQVGSPLLWLLVGAAAVSAFVGEGLDAAIIGLILLASVGLGSAPPPTQFAARYGHHFDAVLAQMNVHQRFGKHSAAIPRMVLFGRPGPCRGSTKHATLPR